MAIYINLGIDCGSSRQAADAIEAHFQGFKVALPQVGEVECEVWRKLNLGHWFLGVWPRGLGYATLRYSRPELLPHEAAIQEALYRHLSLVSGYRRAMFGGEAFDTLWFGTVDELMDNDYAGMIYAEAEFRGPPQGRAVRPFRTGYSIVAGPGAGPGAPPNGSLTESSGSSEAREGPPSVS